MLNQNTNHTTHSQESFEEIGDQTTRTNQSYKAFDEGCAPSGIKLTSELFKRFKNKVFESRPNLGNINTESGSTIFFDYSKKQVRENRNKITRARKKEFQDVMQIEVKKLLGSAIAESVVKQLKENDSISTIQHSAPLGHPYVLSSTLQNALPYFGNTNPNYKNVIVLACASVSFNNYKFPRGKLFHTFAQKGFHTHLLPLIGHTSDSRPVMFHPPYDIKPIIEIENKLRQLMREKEIDSEMYEKLITLFNKTYAAPHALAQDEYHDQLTVTNFWFFKRLFKSYKGAVPNLIFLSQEKITLKLIEKYHLDSETEINKLLFDKSYYPLIKKYFDGLNGAFSTKDTYGTYFFWGYPKDGKYRVQLWREGNYLVSEDKSMKIPLTPEGIQQAIANNELIPNTLLTFIVLAFYYGLILGGGPAQTLNLTNMKKAYIALHQEAGNSEAVNACTDLITTNLVISRPTLAFIEKPKENLRVPATALDLYAYTNLGESWQKIIDASKQTKLDDVMNRILPSFYAEFCPPDEKEEIMTKITERDIEKLTKLDKKIPPLITIK